MDRPRLAEQCGSVLPEPSSPRSVTSRGEHRASQSPTFRDEANRRPRPGGQRARGAAPPSVRFTLPNGATVQFPKTTVDGLIEMLEAVAQGDVATVVRTPREVSTQQAATVLNVSRPTVVKLIDDGALASRKVGSHRRIPLVDLLAYRDDMIARRRAVLDQMSHDAEELGLYG